MWPNNPSPASFQPVQKFQYPVQQNLAHHAGLQRDGVMFAGSGAPDTQIMGPPPPKTPHIQNAMANIMQHQQSMNMFQQNGLPPRTPANGGHISDNPMLNGMANHQFHQVHGRISAEPMKFEASRQFSQQNMPQQQEFNRPWMSSPSPQQQQQAMNFMPTPAAQQPHPQPHQQPHPQPRQQTHPQPHQQPHPQTHQQPHPQTHQQPHPQTHQQPQQPHQQPQSQQPQQQQPMMNMKPENSPAEDKTSPIRVVKPPTTSKSLQNVSNFNSNNKTEKDSPPFGSGVPTAISLVLSDQHSQFWPNMPARPPLGFADKLGMAQNDSLPLPNASQLLSNLSAVPNDQQSSLQPTLDGDEKSSPGSEKPKRKRRKRCGQCEPCHIKKDCGVCYVCRNKGQVNAICKLRKCMALRKKAELEGLEGESLESLSSSEAPMTFKPLPPNPINTLEQKESVIVQRQNSAPTFIQHSKPEQRSDPPHHSQLMTPWGPRYQPSVFQHGHHVNQNTGGIPASPAGRNHHPGPGRPRGSTTKAAPLKNRSFSGVSDVFKVFKDDMLEMNKTTFIHANGVKVCKLMAKMLELNITDEELKASQPAKPAPFAWEQFLAGDGIENMQIRSVYTEDEPQPSTTVITTIANTSDSTENSSTNISKSNSSSKLDTHSAEQSDVDENTQPAVSDPAGVDSGFSSSSPAERQSPSPPNKVTFNLPHQPTPCSSSSAEVLDVKPHRLENVTVAMADSTQSPSVRPATPQQKSPPGVVRDSPTPYSAMSSLSDLTAKISGSATLHASADPNTSGNTEQSHSPINSLDKDLAKTQISAPMFNADNMAPRSLNSGMLNVPHPFNQLVHGINSTRQFDLHAKADQKPLSSLPPHLQRKSSPQQFAGAKKGFPQAFKPAPTHSGQSPFHSVMSNEKHSHERETLPTPRFPEHFEANNSPQGFQRVAETLPQQFQKKPDGSQQLSNNHFFKQNLPTLATHFNPMSTQHQVSSQIPSQMSCKAVFQNDRQQMQSMPMTSSDQSANPIQSIVSSLTNQVMGKTETAQKQPEDSQSLLKNNKVVEPPPCNCNTRPHDESVDGPFYVHLGHASSVANVRKLMETRMGISGNALRIEKVKFTMKEGKTSLGCPAAKWIVRRTGIEEKCLTVVKHRPGHSCDTAWIIVSIVAWEGVPQGAADHMYSYLTRVLPVYGYETERRCGTNQPRDCACQGWDTNRKGASFSFGCSWSVYYNGCKFARSQVPRKFKLRDESFEGVLESKFQALGQHLAPLYRDIAPLSYGGQVRYEKQASDCRIGFRTGRPFSGCTAVVDFCAHQHRDTHNMNNGSTVVVTLTKHRGLSKPDDEQLHTLPLYLLDDTDEFGTKEGFYERIRNGGLEILDRYSEEQRRRSRPYKKKKKGGEAYQSPKVKQAYMQSIEESKKFAGLDAAKNNLFNEQKTGAQNNFLSQNAGLLNNFPPTQHQGPNNPQTFNRMPASSQPNTVEGLTNAPYRSMTNQHVPLGSLPNQNLPHGNLTNQNTPHGNLTNQNVPHGNLTNQNPPHVTQSNHVQPHPNLFNQRQHGPFNHLASQRPSDQNPTNQHAQLNSMGRFQSPTELPSFQSMNQQQPPMIGQPMISSSNHIVEQPGLQTPSSVKQEKAESRPELQKTENRPQNEDEKFQPPKPRPPSPEFDDPDGRDIHDDNAHLFRDPMVGGVAIALQHGSVLFEVAKRELHATTALKQPDRYNPTRISLVFYQHKRLNFKKHGFFEYQKAEEERQKARREAEAQGIEYIPKGLKYKRKRQQEAQARNLEKSLGILRTSSKFYSGIKKKPGRKPGVKKKAKIRFAAYQYLWPQAVNHTISSSSPTVVTAWMKPACIVTGPYQKWVSLHKNLETENHRALNQESS